MNDLNRAAASTDEIAKAVEQTLDARARAELAERTKAERDQAVAKNAQLENELADAKTTLERLQAAIDAAYAGATSDTPAEISKIDRALEVKGDGAGSAVHAAKVAWIADSRKAVAEALVAASNVEADSKLVEENEKLKAELDSMKSELRKAEIEHIFATVLEMEAEKVEKFVEAGLAKATDEAYAEWLEEKKVFAKEMLDLKKKGKDKDKKDAKADDAEAGLLEPSDRETSIDMHGAVLRSGLGRVPGDVARTPRSKLTAAADLDNLFEEVDEPDLAGASAGEGNPGSPMGKLVANLLGQKSEDKDN